MIDHQFLGLGTQQHSEYRRIIYLALVKSVQVDGIHIRFPESSIPQIPAI